MAAMTLVEAAKLEQNDPLKRGIIEIYAGSSGILEALPFMDINGNALRYNREAAYPGIGFRGVNEAYTASNGVINPLTENLVIAGGDLDVDKFIMDTMGGDARAAHVAMKVRALGLAWTAKFIQGDTANDIREFDGLETRITGAQDISNDASTSGGGALSLAKLDELIDQVRNPTHLIMNKAMARKFAAAARNTSVGGYILFDKNELGKRVMTYNDLPIIAVDLDHEGNEILGFDETPTGGGSNSTSIYCVSFSDNGVVGLQNGGIDVRDLGELETAPVMRTRVEWYNGLAIFDGRGAARLRDIDDAAIVV